MNVLHTGPFSTNTLIVPLCDNYCFIVDPACCSFCGDENIVTDFLCQNNLEPIAIVLTHGHFDHVAGLKILKKSYPSIPVLIHQDDSHKIGKNSNSSQEQDLSLMGFFDFIPVVSNLPAADGSLQDKKLLADSFNFNVSENVFNELKKWQIFHTPGHTQGCVCLYNQKDKILISGDTLFFHSWGRTDLVGGDENKIRKSLIFLKENIAPDCMIYPGHDHYGFKMQENF